MQLKKRLLKLQTLLQGREFVKLLITGDQFFFYSLKLFTTHYVPQLQYRIYIIYSLGRVP